MNLPLIILAALLVIVLVCFALAERRHVITSRENAEMKILINAANDKATSLAQQLSLTKQELLQADTMSDSLNASLVQERTRIEGLNLRISEQSATIKDLTDKRAELAQTIMLNEAEKATLNAKIEQATKAQQELIEHQAKLQKQAEDNFKNIANEILKRSSKEFKEDNENRMDEILKPFKENIEGIQNSIKNYYEGGLKETSALKSTIEQLTQLNNQLGKEANELTIALRGNKNNSQGPWGEMILKQILEGSGLIEGTSFKLQATTNFDGSPINDKYRPDAIISIPEKKVIVVDSKVNITAYTKYANADNEDDRIASLKEHVNAVKNQIKGLSSKEYQKAVKGSADFVLMFIPNEGAYIAAMQGDPNLWQEAYNNQVVLVSPTHLISVVKMITQLWNNDKQNKNAIKIAEESGKLLDKLAGFVRDIEEVGKGLEKAQTAYINADKKLRSGTGNILGRANTIKDLGAKASKQLPSPSDPED